MTKEKNYTLSIHARTMISERNISVAWIDQVMSNPEKVKLDTEDPMLCHAFGRIVEKDNRVLHIVYNNSGNPKKIVTAFFDRNMRKNL